MRYTTIEAVVVKLGAATGVEEEITIWVGCIRRGVWPKLNLLRPLGVLLSFGSFIHTWWLGDRLVTYIGIIIFGILLLRGSRWWFCILFLPNKFLILVFLIWLYLVHVPIWSYFFEKLIGDIFFSLSEMLMISWYLMGGVQQIVLFLCPPRFRFILVLHLYSKKKQRMLIKWNFLG